MLSPNTRKANGSLAAQPPLDSIKPPADKKHYHYTPTQIKKIKPLFSYPSMAYHGENKALSQPPAIKRRSV